MRRFLTWLIVWTASLVLPVSSEGGLLKERLGPLVPKDAQWAVSVIDMKTGNQIMSTVNPPHLSPLPPSTGSGQAAARMLLRHTDMGAKEIALEALKAASEICVYTNDEISVEEL